MRILVLGSAAGGGYPQWNCFCPICEAARTGEAQPRTQSSIAVSSDDTTWFLVNASPDLGQQILANKALHPRPAEAGEGVRHSPIGGIVLTNADIDHIAGLLTVRESSPFALWATARVQETLRANSVFGVLNPEFVSRREMKLAEPFELVAPGGAGSGLSVEPFAVPGKVALYLEDETAGGNFGTVEEDTIGLCISDARNGRRFFHVPGCAAVTPALAARLKGAALVLFDGTVWEDAEMPNRKAGRKTGARMGHMAMSGPDGSMAAFAALGVARRIYIHINNTNPVLLPSSPERTEAEAAGWEIGFDGMEIVL